MPNSLLILLVYNLKDEVFYFNNKPFVVNNVKNAKDYYFAPLLRHALLNVLKEDCDDVRNYDIIFPVTTRYCWIPF